MLSDSAYVYFTIWRATERELCAYGAQGWRVHSTVFNQKKILAVQAGITEDEMKDQDELEYDYDVVVLEKELPAKRLLKASEMGGYEEKPETVVLQCRDFKAHEHIHPNGDKYVANYCTHSRECINYKYDRAVDRVTGQSLCYGEAETIVDDDSDNETV